MDFSSDIFSVYAHNSTAESCVIVHRESTLVYYTYMRSLSSDANRRSFFGISLVMNGIITYNIRALFKIFEKSFEQLVISGKLLQFRDNGEVTVEPFGWDLVESASKDTTAKINSYIEDGTDYFEVIPPTNYGVSKNEFTIVSLEDGDSEIKQQILNYQTTYITKNYDFSSPKFNGYVAKLAKLNEQNSLLQALVNDLRNKKEREGASAGFLWFIFAISILMFSLVLFGFFTGHIMIQ